MTSYNDISYTSTSYDNAIAGFGLLCNNEDILCNSEEYLCDGSVRMRDIEYGNNLIPGGWATSNSTLTFGSIGDDGVFSSGGDRGTIRIVDDGAGDGYIYITITITPGVPVIIVITGIDLDGGNDGSIQIGVSADDGSYYGSGTITEDIGTTYEVTITPTTSTVVITLNVGTAGGAYYYYEISAEPVVYDDIGYDLPPWFYDDFNTINPAVWTDYSDGTGVNSIVGAKLKMLSNGAGDYAYLETGLDDTIPEAFTFTFELEVSSGTGELRVTVYTGTHQIEIYFFPPNSLWFRNQSGLPFLEYDVGNYMGSTIIWKFVYNGTTCDIYKDDVLVAASCAIFERSANKGALILNCRDVLTVYLDDYTIIPS